MLIGAYIVYLSHFSVVGAFKNNVVLATQEKDCDLDSAVRLGYLRTKIETESHTPAARKMPLSLCNLVFLTNPIKLELSNYSHERL